MKTTIQSIQIVKPVVSAKLVNVTITFNDVNYANGVIQLLDADDNIVSTHRIPFTLDEMNEWGEDDSYVLNLALEKLNIQL